MNTEPPSRLRLLQKLSITPYILFAARRYLARSRAYRHFWQSLIACLVLLTASHVEGMGVLSLYDAADLSTNERERALLVLGSNLSLQTLQPITHPITDQIITEAKTEPAALQHTVATGETLTEIAESYGLHSGSVILANPQLEDSNLINEGDVLVIPPQDASADALAREYDQRARKYSKVALASAPAVTKKTAETPTVTTIATSSYKLPINRGSIKMVSQPFSSRHTGIDYAMDTGTPVYAAAKGCVTEAARGWNGGYGTVMKLEHSNGILSLYAHLSRFAVPVGTCVNQGDLVAYSGNSGRSTGPHLHFEIRVAGSAVNPERFIPYVR